MFRRDIQAALLVTVAGFAVSPFVKVAWPLAVFASISLPVVGYLFSLVVFPSRRSLNTWERAGASLLVGVAMIPFLALIIQGSPLRYRLVPFFGVLLAIALGAAFLAKWRSRMLPAAECPALETFRWPHIPREARLPAVAFGVGLLLLASVAAIVLPTLGASRGFTEALLLPESGKLTDAAAPLPAATPFNRTLSVVSHELAASDVHVGWHLERTDDTSGSRDAFAPAGNTASDEWDVTMEPEMRANLTIAVPAQAPGLYRLVVVIDVAGPTARSIELHDWLEVVA